MRVVVIGAGVVGASIAFRLAQAGAEVTVLDAGRIGGGTSSVSFAWLNSASGHVPEAYHALRIASMVAHRETWEAFGRPAWFHPSGSLEWVAPEKRAAQAGNIARLLARGYAVEWITREAALAREPDLDPAAIGDAPVAWFPDEGWLDPVPCAGAMLRAARALGAVLREDARVLAIEASGGRVGGVRLADGTRIPADRVVNCAGRWADAIAEDPDPRMQPVRDMMAGAARLFLALRGVEAEAVRIGARPMPKDGLSAVGPMPRMEGYYLAVTHSGVTLSAILGRLVAEEVALDRISAALEPFRPARFFN
ncbi:NAD(P)/FAD-dependent oxidoreductase [Paracraurococcus ruber]|uniref:FAD dependent oxidoreductase domain-containing protein n=1 Tax=Paracraurococcus ruber TaxID=77675 RepID=A0ABS1CT30_9PROT|nr:FAD-dependent oxidoreductase [Paracraurococcus ruber]MBK1657004.1 hypothetical protein [Paracraurococcus ruber]TDG34300.1 FAD-binding oxidoreductase [Paracraurococcus ruber]